MQFDVVRPGFENVKLLGPVTGAPAQLSVGRWVIGIARFDSSDYAVCDPECPSPMFEESTSLLCSAEFQVAPETLAVDVRAHFRDKCSIDVTLTPAASAVSD
jgi:hypothetical protein